MDSHFPGSSVFHLGAGFNHSKAQIVVTRDVLRSKVDPPYRYSNYHPHPCEGFNLSSGDGSIMTLHSATKKQTGQVCGFEMFQNSGSKASR